MQVKTIALGGRMIAVCRGYVHGEYVNMSGSTRGEAIRYALSSRKK